jgi:hypothetical protein
VKPVSFHLSPEAVEYFYIRVADRHTMRQASITEQHTKRPGIKRRCRADWEVYGDPPQLPKVTP